MSNSIGGERGGSILGLVPSRLLFDKGLVVSLAAPFRWLFDFALPPRCPACSVIVANPHAFCSECWQKLNFLAGPACSSCDLPLPYATDEMQQCGACLARAPAHAGIKAAVAYGDVARHVALRLKYGGRIGLARIIADQLARYRNSMPDGTLFVPVPLHWSRLWARGFNQSALIAAELVKGSEYRHVPDLLKRTKRTALLRGLSKRDRAKMVAGAFEVHPRWQDTLSKSPVVLVDDIYTSGATSDACVKALKKGGAELVTIFCWARVLPIGLETGDSIDAIP